ncbi:hypothetical protein OLL83_001183 [Shewanella algae]|uniref:hypothetical protein n=1 Tax=Shewanella algae TaxID=38313 RepID=UPI001182C1D1|nr:hypothetical protein [Shewanella algae]MBO2590036.1 hypothetical protein [Shewanella algae]UZD59634.1 hypothetical protein OLL83_001183 [Shewanella algae]
MTELSFSLLPVAFCRAWLDKDELEIDSSDTISRIACQQKGQGFDTFAFLLNAASTTASTTVFNQMWLVIKARFPSNNVHFRRLGFQYFLYQEG